MKTPDRPSAAHAPRHGMTTAPATPGTGTRSRPGLRTGRGPGRITALDGLRGIAVLAVLVFHAWPAVLPGGFVGVDMFFVLSGFLITTGLVRGVDAGKGLRLGSFWMRRVRRLVPAMVVALVTCTALAWLAVAEFPTGLGRQWLGALTYTSNWLMIFDGGDYFAQASPPLFEHLWSLAIEEQFYLLWPLIIGGICLAIWPKRDTYASGRVADRRRILVVAAIALASAAAMVVGSVNGANQTRLYFGTDTHAFGLLFGACVSMALAHVPRPEHGGVEPRTGALRTAAAWAAVVVLFAGFALVDGTQDVTYRGGLVALAAVVAFLVWHVAQGNRRDSLSRVLSTPFLRWWGRRSYAAYLWHWPLLVIMRIVVPVDAPAWVEHVAAGGVLLLTALIADLSSRLFEEPILHEGFRGAFSRWGSGARRSLAGRNGLGGRLAAVLAALALVAVPATAVAAVVHSPAKTQLEQDIAEAEQSLQDAQAQQQAAREARRSQQAEQGGAASGSPSASASAGGPSSAADPAARLGDPKVTRPEFTQEQLTAALPPSKVGDRTTVVGDSVALSAAPAMLEEMPGVVVDAKVGFQVWDAADKVRALAADGTLGDVLVLSLGANGSGAASDWEDILEAAGPDRLVVVVVPHGPQEWIPAARGHVQDLVEEHPDQVVLADWDVAATKYVTDFSADGVHPRKAGQGIYAQLVRLTIEERLGLKG